MKKLVVLFNVVILIASLNLVSSQKESMGIIIDKKSGATITFKKLKLPIGTILIHSGIYTQKTVAELEKKGWLPCDGRVLTRAKYVELYNTIFTTFGVGDSPGTFRIPNLIGRVPSGSGIFSDLTSRNVSNKIGKTTGSEMHQLSTEEIPSHNHTGTTDNPEPEVTSSANRLTYRTFSDQSGNQATGTHREAQAGWMGTNHNRLRTDTDFSLAAHTHNFTHNHKFTTGDSGGNNPHNNMQPTLYINFIIKVK